MRTALVIATSVGLAVIVLAVPVTAEAKPRVALVTFEGDPGGEAQEVVSDAIGEDVMLVGPKQVNRTVDKLGLDTADLGEKDLRKLSKELQADAVIQGKLSKKGDNKLLHFKLFIHGKKAKGFKVEFASLKSKKLRTQLHDKMIDKLDGGDGGEVASAKKGSKAAATDDDEDPISGGQDKKKKKGAGKDSASTDDTLKTMKKKGGQDGDEDAEVKPSHKSSDDDAPKKKAKPPDEDTADEDKPKKKKVARAEGDDSEGVEASVEVHAASTARPANRVAVRLDLGVSIQNRSLTFTSRAFPEAPKPFSQKPVAGARVAGELYPLAFGNPNGVAGGLGLGGMFDQTIVLNLQSSAQPGTKFPVTQRRFDIGPRFRVLFGHSDTSPSVTLGVGYMKRTFVVNRSALTSGNTIDLPDVDYAGFDPGLEFRIPLIKQLALVFGGQAILLTSAGPIQGLDSYGQAKVTGGSGSAGFDIVLGNHLAISLRGEATQIGYAFTGNGAMANNRDMDPTTKDIGGAADRYLGVAATIAILY
ncbi:MAG TPA: hypothetical protein VFQ65_32415 [Kofleriaceae bacterium]|nr:hypothetical protein [Kofleriaceae bacterium]